MPHMMKKSLSSLLFAAVLSCGGYVAAQPSAIQKSAGKQSVNTPSTQTKTQQQNDQLRDQLAQLRMQVKDLQAEVSTLRVEQQLIRKTAKQNHELVMDSRIVQTQGQENLNLLQSIVGRNEQQIGTLGQQVSSMMLDLGRVKTKLGLY